MLNQSVILHLLVEHYQLSKSKNPSFSLRSFALKMGIHVGTLSSVMNGKRPITLEFASRLLKKLEPDPQIRFEIMKKFCHTIQDQETYRYMELDEDKFRLIAEWEHYAVLSLMNCQDFREDENWIANRLGLTLDRCSDVMALLKETDLIKRNADGVLVRTYAAVRTSDDKVNLALRSSHEENLDLARNSLNRDSLQERDFTHITMAIDPEQIPNAKEIIRKFQDELSDVLERGNRTEVYKFTTALFPLSKINQPNSHL